MRDFVCFCLFVLGLTSLWNIWGHITTVPACSSGTLTNVLPHRNAMPQTQDTTPHPVTVYRHGANLSLCYPSMWNVTLEYTATHFNVLGETRPGNPSLTFHTHQRTFNLMLSCWSTVGSSVENRTNRVLNPGPVVCESSTLSARPQRLPLWETLKRPGTGQLVFWNHFWNLNDYTYFNSKIHNSKYISNILPVNHILKR